ncbi:MAG: hypothetical protein KTR26_10585 [Flammeovirgaceae bacterium]|nr:hypothetical protein [Flammeovirgaceae bacterium]
MPKKKQIAFQLRLGGVCLFVILFFGMVLFLIDARLLPLLFFIIGIVLSVIAPFLDVPSLIKNGDLKYHSLFLLAEKENRGVVKIHGGTLFDYYFALDQKLSGKDRTKLIISEYLKGMMSLAKNSNQELVFKGTSYIINERTADKIGLKKVKTNGISKLILMYNYFNLMASIYLSKNTIEFPSLNRINTYQFNAQDIMKKEQFINKLILKLENSSTTNL